MTERKKVDKKWIWIIVGIFLVSALGAGVVTAIVINNNDNKGENVEVQEDNVEENVEKTAEKKSEKDDTDEVNGEQINEQGEKQKVPQYEGEDPNELDNLTGAISYSGVNTEKWMVRVNIDQYVTEGQCELNLYQGETVVYNNTANIVGVASTSTCEGFDVPVSRLPKGSLKIKINISSGGKTGVIEGETNV